MSAFASEGNHSNCRSTDAIYHIGFCRRAKRGWPAIDRLALTVAFPACRGVSTVPAGGPKRRMLGALGADPLATGRFQEETTMTSYRAVSQTSDLVSRLRRVLLAVDLDCACQTRLEGALNRFTSLESRRQARNALSFARENKDQIIARLAFLAELDELTATESDQTVFDEMALLFDEIGAAAADAASAVRRVPRIVGGNRRVSAVTAS